MAVAAPAVFAQTTPAAAGKALAFDAASIRENANHQGDCKPDQTLATPSGVRLTNCPLMVALVTAYQPASGEPLGFAFNDRLVGMPDWTRQERFDIVARIGEQDAAAWQDPAKQKEMLHAMMRQLLAERFKLVVHREMREKPSFVLVVGKNGPKLKPAATEDLNKIQAKYAKGIMIPGSGGVLVEGPHGSVDLYGATMGTLALYLSSMAQRPVVDQTGLTGKYDIHLDTMPPDGENGAFDRATTIFASVQEQTGLKLEAAKEQVEVLVIDHVEKPSEN
jgi:uncharacterized protein (TIGR03435 family)